MARPNPFPPPSLLLLPPATGDLPQTGGLIVASNCSPFRRHIEHAGHIYQEHVIRAYSLSKQEDNSKIGQPVTENNNNHQQEEKLRAHSEDAAKKLASKMAVGSEDLYELLELGHKRWHATADEIKKSFRRLSLIYHPDKISHHGEKARENAESHFKAVMKAYDILSDKKRRAAYDSIDDVDDSIPTEKDATHSDARFFAKFGECFELNSRWSTSDRVPKLGDNDTDLDTVHSFYDFWYSFKSWRDFSFDMEYDPDQAECREEKRWMERQNAKNSKTKKLEENSRIRRLVDLAYKHDPRLKRAKQAAKAEKAAKKQQRKQKAEEAERAAKKKLDDEKKEAEKKAAEEKVKKAAMKKKRDAQRQIVRKARQKLRAAGRGLGIMETEKTLVAVETMCSKGSAKSIEAVADALTALSKDSEEVVDAAMTLLDKAIAFPQIPLSEHTKCENGVKDDVTDTSSVTNETDVDPGNDGERELPNGSSADRASKDKSDLNEYSDVWTSEELSLLSKAVAKYPGGTRDRWARLATFIGTKSEAQVLQKVNESRPSKIKNSANVQSSKTTAAESSAFARFQERKKGKPVVPQERVSAPSGNKVTPVPAQPPNKFMFTPKQQAKFEEALKKYSKGESERWDKIARDVGRTSDHCQQRFNELIAYYAAKRGAK